MKEQEVKDAIIVVEDKLTSFAKQVHLPCLFLRVGFIDGSPPLLLVLCVPNCYIREEMCAGC
jgi:hypothetical protein